MGGKGSVKKSITGEREATEDVSGIGVSRIKKYSVKHRLARTPADMGPIIAILLGYR